MSARDEILDELQIMYDQAKSLGEKTDRHGSQCGGTTQRLVWAVVKALQEAHANLATEIRTHP